MPLVRHLVAALAGSFAVSCSALAGVDWDRVVVTTAPDAGGTSDGQTPPDSSSPIVVPPGCNAYADAVCAKVVLCSPFLYAFLWPDGPTCKARVALSCAYHRAANGTGLTATNVAECATGWTAGGCEALFSNALPNGCVVAGSLVAGAPCVDDAQCASHACRRAKHAACGTCGTPAGANGACTQELDCGEGTGMACVGGVCVLLGSLGVTCDDNHPCHSFLGCRAGRCATPAATGGACTSDGDCNVRMGDYCELGANQCTPIIQSKAGGPCTSDTGVAYTCTGGALCKTSAADGTCVAPAADGAPCSPDTGPPCLFPAVCDNYRCTLPDATRCK